MEKHKDELTKAHVTLEAIVGAIVATIKESGPLGAPGGAIYAALMERGCSLEGYNLIMQHIIASGAITKRGDCYFYNK